MKPLFMGRGHIYIIVELLEPRTPPFYLYGSITFADNGTLASLKRSRQILVALQQQQIQCTCTTLLRCTPHFNSTRAASNPISPIFTTPNRSRDFKNSSNHQNRLSRLFGSPGDPQEVPRTTFRSLKTSARSLQTPQNAPGA